jgi:uncharacterized protein YifE (UPF0438 family)
MLPREHYLKQSFADSVHFPNGFEKGGLSDIQARLVRKNGTLINALCIDEVSDPTPEDLHILKVVANQSSPKNPVEQAWVKYLSLVKGMAATMPKSKSKAKPTKPAAEEPTPEPVKPVAKTEKPAKAAEKAPTIAKASVAVKAPAKVATKKVEPVVEAKPKAPAQKEKIESLATKAPAKVAAKTVEPSKKETKKAEVKKPEVKKTEVKKADTKKVDVKKAEPQKAASKKVEPKVEAKKPAAKKPGKSK